jgi:hypothetical protein
VRMCLPHWGITTCEGGGGGGGGGRGGVRRGGAGGGGQGWEVVLRVRGLVRELLGSLSFSLDQQRGRGWEL